jgi:hypothetical protein
MPCTPCVTTPPPVGCDGSLPVDFLKNEVCLPTGFPSVSTDRAPPSKSAAMTVLGSGVGMGPAGGVGGQRQTSGKAIDWPALPLCTTARPLMKTVSPTISSR